MLKIFDTNISDTIYIGAALILAWLYSYTLESSVSVIVRILILYLLLFQLGNGEEAASVR